MLDLVLGRHRLNFHCPERMLVSLAHERNEVADRCRRRRHARLVADRLSPRQWVLLSAAFVRKLWDLLPDGVLRDAIDFAERADAAVHRGRADRVARKIDAAVPAAVGAAELAQREIVKSCDPTPPTSTSRSSSRPNQIAPAFPLFQAASRNARNAIERIANAVTEAAQAVRVLFAEPNEEMLELVRNR